MQAPDLKSLADHLRLAADQCDKQAKTVQAGADANMVFPPWLSTVLSILKTILDTVPIA